MSQTRLGGDPTDDSDFDPDTLVPEPPDNWWQYGPGEALRRAFSSFEHGIAYYGLRDQQLDGGVLDSFESRIYKAFQEANRFTEIALALLHGDNKSLVVPSDLTKGRKSYEKWSRENFLRLLKMDEAPTDTQTEPPTLQNEAGAWCLYRATIAFGIARLLPGIKEEQIDPDGNTNTLVQFDEVAHNRVRKLLSHLAQASSDRAKHYLARVARCYVFGMTTELALVARAALEAYLKELRGLEETSQETLDNLIEQCRNRGVLPADALEPATRVRTVGNAAAHGRDIEVSPEALLADLASVLNAKPSTQDSSGLTSASS